MKVAKTYVEYCGECPFAGWRNSVDFQVCGMLSQEQRFPFEYVPIEREKTVRADCPLDDE